jgi:hypothetical protein
MYRSSLFNGFLKIQIKHIYFLERNFTVLEIIYAVLESKIGILQIFWKIHKATLRINFCNPGSSFVNFIQ